MVSGKQTLKGVRDELAAQRKRLAELDRRLQWANEQLLKLDSARAKQLQLLARSRLGGPGLESTDARDERVERLLAGRRQSHEELEKRLEELAARRESLEASRERLIAGLEEKAVELDEAEAAVQEQLKTDENYLEQLRRVEEAQDTAHFADAKAKQSEAEREQKGEAYERDRLFRYLWKRGYGTADYRAWALTRWLDRKLARHIGFDRARANYFRLTELPKRLREHADRMEKIAGEELERLRQLDEAARAQAGVTGISNALDANREELEKSLEELQRTVTAQQQTLDELERMDRGEDDAFRQALALLASELESEDLQTLRSEALSTPQPDDDEIVAELLDLEEDREELAQDISDLKVAAQAARKRVGELEDVVRGFTQRQLDAPGSGFPDEDLIENVLGQFLRGVITSHVLWRILEGQRRGPERRSDPWFGSGGFGKGTPWGSGGWPGGGSSRSGGSRSIGRAGGSARRGGFSGGGSRSRGGFQTGGGMRRGGRR